MQYYGWALRNRAALMPTRAQLEAANADGRARRARGCKGRLVIDYVVPDYYAARPKACMGGWGRRFINIDAGRPGAALPRGGDAAGLRVPLGARPRAGARSGASPRPSTRFRGTDWMPEPCRSCDRREIDWGGCRCQAFALTGDAAATDPACILSPHHGVMADAVADALPSPPDFVYRRIGAVAAVP